MGILNLTYIQDILAKRKELSEYYDQQIKASVGRPLISPDVNYNYAYYPILISSEKVLLDIVGNLNAHEIFPRRYFYPSLSELPYVARQVCSIAEDISKRVLCLPLYHDLTKGEIELIAGIVNKLINRL
jgi:dTDP-4-amino-4,6-dideoxygalactose transaminase